jgi:hypothetical protein
MKSGNHRIDRVPHQRSDEENNQQQDDRRNVDATKVRQNTADRPPIAPTNWFEELMTLKA